MQPIPPPPNGTRWLWWTALLIGVVAAVSVYLVRRDIESQSTGNMIILIAVVAIGICVISATSQWWVRR